MANIGIDLDDVLADFMGAYTVRANRMFGRPALGTMPVDWAWSNFGLSKEEQDAVWAEIANEQSFWEKLDQDKGASIDAVRSLDDAHNLSYITARVRCNGDTVLKQSCRWLLNNYGVPFPQVFVAYDKAATAIALKLDYFIDDRPKNVIEIKNAVPSCKVFLKDSSHNQPFSRPDIPRIKDFNEFAQLVMEETK